MKILKISLLFMLLSYTSVAQSKMHWWVGLGTNALADNGGQFSKLTDFNTLNFVPYISAISVGRELPKGFSLEAIFTYNKLWENKLINGLNNPLTSNYYSGDLYAKYGFPRFFKSYNWFIKPFVGAGAGYSYRGIRSFDYSDPSATYKSASMTGNLIVGFNIEVTKNIKVCLQSVGKFKIGNQTSSNHIQHELLFTYNFTGSSGRNQFYQPKRRR